MQIDVLMGKFCDAGAKAVEPYSEISGEWPSEMPEYFMPSFIANNLGARVTSTLETNFTSLVTWNNRARVRHGAPVVDQDSILLELAGKLKGRIVDMVLFEGQEKALPKDNHDILAICEFKSGWLDADARLGQVSDRDKVLMILAAIDTCPWGIVCGWAPKVHYDWQKQLSSTTDDKWFEAKIEVPDAPRGPLYFCARVFRNDRDNPRLLELIDSMSA